MDLDRLNIYLLILDPVIQTYVHITVKNFTDILFTAWQDI